jgi:hypothetical protein
MFMGLTTSDGKGPFIDECPQPNPGILQGRVCPMRRLLADNVPRRPFEGDSGSGRIRLNQYERDEINPWYTLRRRAYEGDND